MKLFPSRLLKRIAFTAKVGYWACVEEDERAWRRTFAARR